MARPHWSSLPVEVRDAVAGLLGGPVVCARSAPGGWSPGVAALVECADGTTAFVKAASSEVNPRTPEMHRTEAATTRLLPEELGGARVLGTWERGPWFVLVLSAVDGRPPVTPWTADELAPTLAALDGLSDVPAPSGLLSVEEVLRDDLDRWPLLEGAAAALPGWEATALPRLVELEQGWRTAAAGDRLVHLDVRADNVLLRPDGTAVLVDWASAARGAPLVDVLAFAPSVVLDGGPDVPDLLRRTAAGRAAPAEHVLALGVALLGLLRWRSLQPAPPGMPTVRAFQRARADVLSAWLRHLVRVDRAAG